MLWPHVRYANWENPQLTLLTLFPLPGTPFPTPRYLIGNGLVLCLPSAPTLRRPGSLGLGRAEGPPL